MELYCKIYFLTFFVKKIGIFFVFWGQIIKRFITKFKKTIQKLIPYY